MAVRVRVTANFQKLIGGERSVEGEGKTVTELLDDLERRFPGFKDNVMSDGELQRFVNIYLNDEDIRFLEKLETPLSEGDVVSILPALAGG